MDNEGYTTKFHYLQILFLLPLLPNSVTCKFHGIHYRQFPLLANSTPLLPKSITYKFSDPSETVGEIAGLLVSLSNYVLYYVLYVT